MIAINKNLLLLKNEFGLILKKQKDLDLLINFYLVSSCFPKTA